MLNAVLNSGVSKSLTGEAKSDLWQIVEFAKRFNVEEVWPAELVNQNLSIAVKIYMRCCLPTM